MGLDEHPALERAFAEDAVDLFERDDDAQPPPAPLAPVRAAEEIPAP